MALGAFVNGLTNGIDIRNRWQDRKRNIANDAEDREWARENRDWTREDRGAAIERRDAAEDRRRAAEARRGAARTRKAEEDRLNAEFMDAIENPVPENRRARPVNPAAMSVMPASRPTAPPTPAPPSAPMANATSAPAPILPPTSGPAPMPAVTPTMPAESVSAVPVPMRVIAQAPAQPAPTPVQSPTLPPEPAVAQAAPRTGFGIVSPAYAATAEDNPAPATQEQLVADMERRNAPVPYSVIDEVKFGGKGEAFDDYQDYTRQRTDYGYGVTVSPNQPEPAAGAAASPTRPVPPVPASPRGMPFTDAQARAREVRTGIYAKAPVAPPTPVSGPRNTQAPPAPADARPAALTQPVPSAPQPMSVVAVAEAAAAEGVAPPSAVEPNKPAPSAATVERVATTFQRTYNTEKVDAIVAAYRAKGEFDKAQKYRDFVRDTQTQAAMKNWSKALVAASLGDERGFINNLAAVYNNDGYYDDGYSVDPDASSLTRDDAGNIVGGKIMFINNDTGERFENVIEGQAELYRMGIDSTSPETVFERRYADFLAGREQAAERLATTTEIEDKARAKAAETRAELAAKAEFADTENMEVKSADILAWIEYLNSPVNVGEGFTAFKALPLPQQRAFAEKLIRGQAKVEDLAGPGKPVVY